MLSWRPRRRSCCFRRECLQSLLILPALHSLQVNLGPQCDMIALGMALGWIARHDHKISYYLYSDTLTYSPSFLIYDQNLVFPGFGPCFPFLTDRAGLRSCSWAFPRTNSSTVAAAIVIDHEHINNSRDTSYLSGFVKHFLHISWYYSNDLEIHSYTECNKNHPMLGGVCFLPSQGDVRRLLLPNKTTSTSNRWLGHIWDLQSFFWNSWATVFLFHSTISAPTSVLFWPVSGSNHSTLVLFTVHSVPKVSTETGRQRIAEVASVFVTLPILLPNVKRTHFLHKGSHKRTRKNIWNQGLGYFRGGRSALYSGDCSTNWK